MTQKALLVLLLTSLLACANADTEADLGPITISDGSNTRTLPGEDAEPAADIAEDRAADGIRGDTSDISEVSDLDDTEAETDGEALDESLELDVSDSNSGDLDLTDGADADLDLEEDEGREHVDCYALPDEVPLVINGDLDEDGPTWNLPNTADCSVESDIATTPFETFTLCKTTSGGEFDLRLEGGRDRGELTLRGVAVFVYSGARIPDDSTTCVGQTHNVEQLGIIENLPVSDGEEILLMATSFVEGVGGTYRITITRQPE